MSRILADAKPASPRVGCILLRCRLGARGRDGSLPRPFSEPERQRLVGELAVIAGRVAMDTFADGRSDAESTGPSTVVFVDPASTLALYGGDESWARCVKGYLNARGYAVSVAVADTHERALEAARARWGISVVRDTSTPRNPGSTREPTRQPSREASRQTTAIGIRAIPRSPTSPQGSSSSAHQLGLPGLKMGRPKRPSRKRAA